MSNLKEIFEKNRNWVSHKLAENPEYFQELASGQSPEILCIGCSDSRVALEIFTEAEPGEIFVHRNVANQVIETDVSVNTVIEFAVNFLKVKHIVVCGHTKCGGVLAAMEPEDMGGALNPWLQTLRNVYSSNQKELEAIQNKEERETRFVELNVIHQSLNVSKNPSVQKALKIHGIPKIHGWVFDLHTGLLKDLNPEIKAACKNLSPVYQIL